MATSRFFIPITLLVSLSAFGIAGCGGSDGNDGAAGATGGDGAAGLSCWDLNMNGVPDFPDEDINGDGVIDVFDCQAPVATVVEGTVSSTTGDLDQFVSLAFAAAAPAVPIEAVVLPNGSYTVDLDPGTYDVSAARPGYEDFEQIGYVVGSGENALDIGMVAMLAGEFISSEDCGVCHETKYDTFVQTGHPYKLNRAFGEQPQYPFSTLDGVLERVTDEDGQTDNSLGTPQSYDDVSYVIGGFFWKARFVDLAGAIVTGSEVQYNFATDGMVAYHDDEVDKPYNCGNCHTTGWRAYDDVKNPNREDDMEHMAGTFFEGGVHCEACHSAGSMHAQTMDGGDIVEIAVPRTIDELLADDAGYGLAISCGECHTRDGERDTTTYQSGYNNALIAAGRGDEIVQMGGRIAASGGLTKHHEQYDEALGIDPDTLSSVRSAAYNANHLDCGTCHNPHGSSVYQDDPAYTGVQSVDKSNANCMGCHPTYDPTLRSGGMMGLDCINCHMPPLAKSAVATAAVGEGPVTGDVSTHSWRINLDSTQFQQFTADGSFTYPWITTDFACRTCHNGVDLFGVPDALADTFIYHNNLAP